jgi:proteasome lid subunit RPN8/RPN11
VVIPDGVACDVRAHAEAELPNEACGLLLLRDGQAERYVRGRNADASPYRFKLELDASEWADIGDQDYEQAVVHSHISSAPYPSRTDVENIGLWAGLPYVIYSLGRDDLAAFRIWEDGRIERVDLEPTTPRP